MPELSGQYKQYNDIKFECGSNMMSEYMTEEHLVDLQAQDISNRTGSTHTCQIAIHEFGLFKQSAEH